MRVHPELEVGDVFQSLSPYCAPDERWIVDSRTDWWVSAHCPTRTGESARSSFSGEYAVVLEQDSLW